MALYSFCDTTQTPGAGALPAEALCYNGIWIDNDISLYRTLYVSGRESFSVDFTELELESLDGALFLRRRFLPRTIMVGYQLAAATPAAFRAAFNRLAKLLSVRQARIIFADEPDKFFVGTCRGIGDPEPGRLAVKAEMEIYCADPCKYSLTESEAAVDGNGVFAVEYGGSYTARPAFTAAFSGAAKAVMFEGNDAVVTIGDADADSSVFEQGDVLLVDCASGEIYVNGIRRPGLGDIANEYEKMILNPGANIITPSFTGAAPVFSMKYREAWL